MHLSAFKCKTEVHLNAEPVLHLNALECTNADVHSSALKCIQVHLSARLICTCVSAISSCVSEMSEIPKKHCAGNSVVLWSCVLQKQKQPMETPCWVIHLKRKAQGKKVRSGSSLRGTIYIAAFGSVKTSIIYASVLRGFNVHSREPA